MLLLLAPALVILGYWARPQVGAVLHNLVHTYAPSEVAARGLFDSRPLALTMALLW